MSSHAIHNDVFELDILRVAALDVLGKTKRLTVASPCPFPNAKGELRAVDSYEAISATAESSAEKFLKGIRLA